MGTMNKAEYRMNINEIVRINIIAIMNQNKISVKDIYKKSNQKSIANFYKYLNRGRNFSLAKTIFFTDALNVNLSLILSENFYIKNKSKNYDIYSMRKSIDPERDNTIYYYRVVSKKKKTLQELGTMFNISRERVRQIKNKLTIERQKK
jgi:hypothetical protein